MKNKGNKLLAVALLGLSVMLVGCDPDEKKLTETQKTALLGVKDVNPPILIGVGTDSGYTYSYKNGNTDLTKADVIGTKVGTTDGISIAPVKPELGGTKGKVDLAGSPDIKSGSFLLTSGTLKYIVSSNAGDNEKQVYVSGGTGATAEELSDKKAESYVSTFDFSIDVTPKGEDKEVSVSGTVTYDTTGTRAANCTNFDPTANQGTELQYESKGTGLYAAISTAGEFLICKKS